MITLSSEASNVLAGAGFTYFCRVESWLGGSLLADDVPIVSAGEETDRSLRIPERAVFTVPRLDNGVDWSPNRDDHPLAANGQRLHVKLGIGLSHGQVEWFARARYLIQDAQVEGDRIQVTGVGLLTLVDEARLVSPFQPTSTLIPTLRALVEPALTVLVDGALIDRSVPSAVNWDEDRLGAVLELLDAWPAAAVVDPLGFLRVAPAPTSTTPVLTLTSARGGTVITASGNSSREGAVNAVVARGTQSDGAQIQGVAYVTTGPKAYGGPFNPLPVPYFFSSPLLTTVGQCNDAAATIVARKLRETATEILVSTVPNPAVQAGDVVSVDGALYTVEALTLPYVAAAGSMPPMALTCRAVTS